MEFLCFIIFVETFVIYFGWLEIRDLKKSNKYSSTKLDEYMDMYNKTLNKYYKILRDLENILEETE